MPHNPTFASRLDGLESNLVKSMSFIYQFRLARSSKVLFGVANLYFRTIKLSRLYRFAIKFFFFRVDIFYLFSQFFHRRAKGCKSLHYLVLTYLFSIKCYQGYLLTPDLPPPPFVGLPTYYRFRP